MLTDRKKVQLTCYLLSLLLLLLLLFSTIKSDTANGSGLAMSHKTKLGPRSVMNYERVAVHILHSESSRGHDFQQKPFHLVRQRSVLRHKQLIIHYHWAQVTG